MMKLVSFSRGQVYKSFLFLILAPVMFLSGSVMSSELNPEPVWLRFERSGGFAGFTQTMDMSENGAVIYNEIPKFTDKERVYILNPDGMDLISRQIESVDFKRLAKEYKPDHVVADGYKYILEYDESIVTVYQEAVIPSGLHNLILMMEEVLAKQYLDPSFGLSSASHWQLY